MKKNRNNRLRNEKQYLIEKRSPGKPEDNLAVKLSNLASNVAITGLSLVQLGFLFYTSHVALTTNFSESKWWHTTIWVCSAWIVFQLVRYFSKFLLTICYNVFDCCFWTIKLYPSKLRVIWNMLSFPHKFWESAREITRPDVVGIGIHYMPENNFQGGSPEVYMLIYLFTNGSVKVVIADTAVIYGFKDISRIPSRPEVIFPVVNYQLFFNPNLSIKERQSFIPNEKAIHKAINAFNAARYKVSLLNNDSQDTGPKDDSG